MSNNEFICQRWEERRNGKDFRYLEKTVLRFGPSEYYGRKDPSERRRRKDRRLEHGTKEYSERPKGFKYMTY